MCEEAHKSGELERLSVWNTCFPSTDFPGGDSTLRELCRRSGVSLFRFHSTAVTIDQICSFVLIKFTFAYFWLHKKSEYLFLETLDCDCGDSTLRMTSVTYACRRASTSNFCRLEVIDFTRLSKYQAKKGRERRKEDRNRDTEEQRLRQTQMRGVQAVRVCVPRNQEFNHSKWSRNLPQAFSAPFSF